MLPMTQWPFCGSRMPLLINVAAGVVLSGGCCSTAAVSSGRLCPLRGVSLGIRRGLEWGGLVWHRITLLRGDACRVTGTGHRATGDSASRARKSGGQGGVDGRGTKSPIDNTSVRDTTHRCSGYIRSGRAS
jgi:hypothetical protein